MESVEQRRAPTSDAGSLDVRVQLPQDVARIIVSPDCHDRLVAHDTSLFCECCSRPFPVAAEVLPVLFSKRSPLRDRETEFASWKRERPRGTARKGYRQQRRLPRTDVASIGSRVYAETIGGVPDDGLILNLGSGERSPRTKQGWINLDIRPHNNADVVADGHWLPFESESFDLIVAVSVFEHLPRPFDVARECFRVLKPAGRLLVDVPFLYPVHGSPGDYFRYTSDGLASVLGGFDVLSTDATIGPFTALGLLMERVVDTILPGRVLGFAARWSVAWMIHPFKYLDPWLLKRGGNDVAAGFCVVGRKPEHSQSIPE